MSELSPYCPGGSGFPDSARNLAGLLTGIRAGESNRAAALRIQTRELALSLADRWLAEPQPVSYKRRFDYNAALWKLRELAVDLSELTEPAQSALRTVLDSLLACLHIDADFALRPSGLSTFWARDQVRGLRDRLSEVNTGDSSPAEDMPERYLIVKYPLGEQDNALMTCVAVPYLLGPGMQSVAAVSILGPAYFFALAAEIQNYKVFSDTLGPPNLCFVGELLEISGWLDHSLVGPLIKKWRDQFELGPDYLKTHVLHERHLAQMREAKEQYRNAQPLFGISDFDRTVLHRMESLRKGQSPVDGTNDSEPANSHSAIAGILNAGWITSQLYLPEIYERSSCSSWIDRYNVRCDLNRALADAIRDAGARTTARS